MKTFLRDFVLSKPLPNIMVESAELQQYIKNSAVCETAKFNGEVYIRYPNLFGKESILRNVYFKKNLLLKVTNHYLYGLEALLNNQCEDDRGLDEYLQNPDTATYLVMEISTPLSLQPFYTLENSAAVV